ncbi:MAG: hypothetical protein NKF70_03985 [Methanobacterium sp. ERen5]|nr:MAG: hypothetical protein NKF70_03985 [Methanobacterium sp. ERen5]
MINKLVEAWDEEINEKKSKRYKGIISHKVGTNDYYALQQLSDKRKDLEVVNKGQFKIIYDQQKSYIKSAETDKPKRKPNFKIRFNKPFYKHDLNYFNKDDKSIRTFLLNANKVGLSRNMILIPFNISKKCYYITINNNTELILLNKVNTCFNYISKQSNLYFQIIGNISDTLNDFYKDFERKLLGNLQESTRVNSALIKELSIESNDLLNSKYIINTND